MSKLTRTQHLLIRLGEECNEVAQRISKALVFGLDEIQEGQNFNNRERIQHELSDLLGITEMLMEENVISLFNADTDRRIMEKKQKVEKYLEYCKEIGTL